MLLIHLAPLFIIFDFAQLILAERFIGVKQIRDGRHPLDSGWDKPAWLAALWLLGTAALWFYMVALIFTPWGGIHGFIMLAISVLGLVLRRALGLRFALVVLTVEGAARMGLLVNLLISVHLWGGSLIPPGYRGGFSG